MKNNKKERGVALLYVLGILALLMMMALAFVSSSLFDQRAAANIARRSQANILALSMLERVTAAIQESGGDVKYSFSNELSRDMFDALDTYHVIGGDKKSYLFNYHNPSAEDKTIKEEIRWITHKIKDASSDDLVIGRSAFIVKSYGRGLFNAHDLSKGSLLNEQDRFERRIGVRMNEVNVKSFDNTFFSSSIGTVAQWAELFNQDGTGNGVLSTSITNIGQFETGAISKSGVTPIPPANIDTIGKYFVFTGVGSKEAYWMDLSQDGKRDGDEWFHRFYLPGFEDTDGDGFFTSADTGHNIWEDNKSDPLRADKLLLMSSNYNGNPNIYPVDPNTVGGMWRLTHPTPALDPDEKDKYGCGIPWLATFGRDNTAELKGTFNYSADDHHNAKNRRQQIAANLIDYCDKDNVPTSDVLPADWDLITPARIPKYTGNERTPYLNEIQATITVGAKLTEVTESDDSRTVTIDGKLYFSIDAEAINIYKSLDLDPSKLVAVELRCSFTNVEVKASVGGSAPVDLPLADFSDPFAPSTTIDLTTPPVSGYFVGTKLVLAGIPITASQGGFSNITAPAVTGELKVKFDLKIENAILKYEGNNVDYCKIDKTYTFDKAIEAKNDNVLETKKFIYSTQTEDPRQNLNSGDWSGIAGGEEGSGDPPIVTNIGICNLRSKPNAPPDMNSGDFSIETVTDPAFDGTNHMSTAHIRNAPMISPWELAFIHRGAKWETLNLKAYNEEKARSLIKINLKDYLPGGGKYSEGDANILDQIKMTIDPISNDKKLNLADATDGVLKGFLGGLYLGCEPNLDDTKLPKTPNVDGSFDANNFVDLLARSGSEASVPDSWIDGIKNIRENSTRAGLALAGVLHQGTTEASKTEIIGKIINLVEINKDSPMEYFEAIILSQSIKDVGDASGISIKKGFTDKFGNLVIKNFTGPSNKAKKGQIDYIREGPSSNYVYYVADDVTGQCKLLVSGYRNPGTHKVQLISIKTVE